MRRFYRRRGRGPVPRNDAVACANDPIVILAGMTGGEASPPCFVPRIPDPQSPTPPSAILPRCGKTRSNSCCAPCTRPRCTCRSEEHTSELQSLMRISYAVFCLKKKKKKQHTYETKIQL